MNLDYTIKDAKSRQALVDKIIQETPQEKLTPYYLDALSNYIIDAIPNNDEILTDNRLLTINKRETSFEGLVSKLENGQDGIYGMLSDLGKNAILTPKIAITQEDLDNHSELRQVKDAIAGLEESYKKAKGKDKYIIKKSIIELRQDQYVIKNALNPPVVFNMTTKSLARTDLYDNYYFDEDGNPVNSGPISFFNPAHISTLLCNYSALKQESYGEFQNDLWYLMEDLDNLIDSALEQKYPMYYDLLRYKIDGKTNAEIQDLLARDYGVSHSVEYLSALWRNKIPKLIAEKAEEEYLLWYYTNVERGNWKKCSRCGQVKLAHNKFFSKNKSSKDGWYSLCKECRNAGSLKNKKGVMHRVSRE